jgi:hypothetical protein
MVMPYGGLNRMKSNPGRTPPFRRAKKETLIQLQCVLIMQANDTIMMGHGWTVNTHSNSASHAVYLNLSTRTV